MDSLQALRLQPASALPTTVNTRNLMDWSGAMILPKAIADALEHASA